MAAYISEIESQNFYRLVALLIDSGSKVLRKVLLTYVKIQSGSLDQHLLNNKRALETLQQKKHIISQPQMDLMFPSGGRTDVDCFDITLVSCLLKNICGTLPKQEQEDIEHLRKAKNKIVSHLATTEININDFNTLWSEISQAIDRLARCSGEQSFVQEMMDEISQQKNKPKLIPANQFTDMLQWCQMDPDTRQQYTDVKFKLEEIEKQIGEQQIELHAVLLRTSTLEDKVKEQSEKLDPALVKLRKSSRQFLVSNTHQDCVETQAMQQVTEKLEQTGRCVISGKPGEGKTMAAATILKNRFNIDKCLVLSNPWEWETVDVEETEAVFIDDIFGIYQLDEDFLRKWLRVLDKVEANAGTQQSQVKVLIATRGNILRECYAKVSRYSLFNDVVEFASDKLLAAEKEKMLKVLLQHNNKELGQNKIDRCVRKFTSPIGFPFCCHLFSTNPALFDLGEEFFKNPFTFFKVCLSRLEEVKFAALVFLFHNKGEVRGSELLGNKPEHCADLQEITSSLGMDRPTPLQPSVIRRHLDQMKGIYVTYSQSSFSFIHNTVSQVIGLMYGKENPAHVLRACSSDFLHQCVTVDDKALTDTDEELKLVIENDYLSVLAERLIREVVEEAAVDRVAAHPALCDQTFLTVFVQTIRATKNESKFFRMLNCNVPKRTFLSHYVRVLGDHESTGKYLSALLASLGTCDHPHPLSRQECWKCEVKCDCMNACCECENKAVFHLLLQLGIAPDRHTLNCAIKVGHADIVRAVLDRGILPDTGTINRAVRAGNAEIVRILLEEGVVPNTEILNCATERGNLDIVRIVLKHGAVPDELTINWAAQGGSIDIVKEVLEYGAKPDTETLNCAVWGGNVDVVKAMIANGAVPDALTVNWAAQGGDRDIFVAVMEQEVQIDEKAMNCAIWGDNVEIVRALLDRGLSATEEDVHFATQKGNAEIISAILGTEKTPTTGI